MVALTPSTPGLAGSDSETYTQDNVFLAGRAPTMTNYGYTFNDLAQYTLVGRVTITGELVVSDANAADGSQVPVGVTTHPVTVNGSNSSGDSNSAVDADREDVGYYTDGVFNYDRLTKGGNWTLASLRAALDASGANFGVDEIKTATPTEPA